MLRRKPAPWGSSLGRHIELFGTPPQLAVPMGAALPRGATNAPCASVACGHIVLPHAQRTALAQTCQKAHAAYIGHRAAFDEADPGAERSENLGARRFRVSGG